MSPLKKTETNPLAFKQKLAEFKIRNNLELRLTLMVQKNKSKVAAAAVINKDVFSARLQDEATIFLAEVKVIELAFEYIKMSKYIHILQYFQIHSPVYSLFIV